jgi:hypothetical protein
MAKNDELINRGKALKDLEGIKDVLLAQGDPFLASIMNRAIECIKNQPAASTEPATTEPATTEPATTALWIESYSYGCWHYDCSNCDGGYAMQERDENPPNFCQDCGAAMIKVGLKNGTE